jgi:hypothetical protein
MKKVIICILGIIVGVLAIIKETRSQQLEFIYAAPTATMDGAFNNARAFTRVINGTATPVMTGYRYVYINAGNSAQFHTVGSDNMKKTYDSINSATSGLRRKLNRVMQLSGNRVSKITFFLIDDRTGLPNNTDSIFCQGSQGSAIIAWPCASNWRANAATGTYRGRVMIGEQASRIDIAQAGGFKRWEATIIHEVSHTQMLRDVNGINKWDNRTMGVNGISISYGGDDGHWFEELQADEQQPMDEGLGYFWALEHNPPMTTELDNFLNRSDNRFLLGSRSFLSGTAAMWNAPHVVLCNGIPCVGPTGTAYNVRLNTWITPPTGGYELRSYKWLDVPGKFVFYNEQMSMAYFYLFHRYGFNQRDTAYNKIFDGVKKLCMTPNQRHRYPAHAANMFANSMEAYARSAAGQADAANNSLVSSMFAYALYDLLGHFGQSEADLRREFDINSATYIPYTPKPLAFNQYWAHRNQVKQIACQYLGGNNCAAGSTGTVNIHQAVAAVRDYFKDSTRILR